MASGFGNWVRFRFDFFFYSAGVVEKVNLEAC